MRRYGTQSAILTILVFRRADLKTKEAVKQQHLVARKRQLEREIGKRLTMFQRILSEDLESFYTSLQNPEIRPKIERVRIFSTQKLTEEELTLLEFRNREYLKTFRLYRSESLLRFDHDMRRIENSSDPESIFSNCVGYRKTITLHVTLKSMQEEMREVPNGVPNENQSDVELHFPEEK